MRILTLKKVMTAINDIIAGGQTPPDLSLKLTETYHYMTLTVSQTGEITISESYSDMVTTFITQDEVYRMFLDFNDWSFIGAEQTTEETAFNLIWTQFWNEKKEVVGRAYSDLKYEYNPIYNYDRSEVNYYNLSDDGGTEYQGSGTLGRTYNGKISTGTLSKTATEADAQSGKSSTDVTATLSHNDEGFTYVVEKGALSTGETWKEVRYVNSYEDNTNTSPNNATDSTAQTGVTANTTVAGSVGTSDTYYDGYGYSDTQSFNNRKDIRTNDRKGQTGLRVFGNIGVTTSTQMVKEDVDFRMKVNLVDDYIIQFITKYCFLGCDSDDD